jgi:hypothetical protein
LGSCWPARAGHEPQEAAAAVPRGEPAGQAPAWPQASDGHPSADDAAAGSEPALEPRLRQRHADQRRRIRILAVVDDFTRECLALVVDTSLSGARRSRARRHHRGAACRR